MTPKSSTPLSAIDGSVYPDKESPLCFNDDYERADYIHRISTALDFGVAPECSTLQMLRHWRAVFDQFPVSQSLGYHTLRAFFGWNEVPSTVSARRPYYRSIDMQDGRSDPCEDMI